MKDVVAVVRILLAGTFLIFFAVRMFAAVTADDWTQAIFWLLCVWMLCRLLASRSV